LKRPRFSPSDIIGDNVEVNLSILDGGSGSGDGEEENTVRNSFHR